MPLRPTWSLGPSLVIRHVLVVLVLSMLQGVVVVSEVLKDFASCGTAFVQLPVVTADYEYDDYEETLHMDKVEVPGILGTCSCCFQTTFYDTICRSSVRIRMAIGFHPLLRFQNK